MNVKTHVHVTYFKESGKYYSSAEYGSELELDYEIYEEIRKMVYGYRGGLPGLSTTTWKHYILVEPENGVPALLDMREEDLCPHHISSLVKVCPVANCDYIAQD